MKAILAKQFLMATALLTLCFFGNIASTHAARVDLGSTSNSTPYDRYMSPVKQVLNNLDRGSDANYQQVSKLLRTARKFRYSFKTDYVANSPSVTESRRSGDCKDKSLWLVDRMNDSNVRFVIGRLKKNSKIKHAWVLWQNDGEWFILDPTHRTRPLAVKSLKSGHYIPYYSYAKGATYQHSATRPAFATNNSRQEAIAAKETPSKRKQFKKSRSAKKNLSFAERMKRRDRRTAI